VKGKTQKVHIQAWVQPRLLADLVHWVLTSDEQIEPALATPAYIFTRLLITLHSSINRQFKPQLFTENSEALRYLTQHGFMPRGGVSSIRNIKPIEIDLSSETVLDTAIALLEQLGEKHDQSK
jgi:hypothetical protein